jgi:hypothetical protein
VRPLWRAYRGLESRRLWNAPLAPWRRLGSGPAGREPSDKPDRCIDRLPVLTSLATAVGEEPGACRITVVPPSPAGDADGATTEAGWLQVQDQ